MKKRWVVTPLLGLVALSATAILFRAAAGDATAADPTGGRYAFMDRDRGTTFSVIIDASSPEGGRFSFAGAGLGVVWSDTPASVEVKSDNSVIVRYEGPGRVDAGAQFDPVFGLHRVVSAGEPVRLRLEAQVNPDRVTSVVDLWMDSLRYKMVDRKPPSDPRFDLTAVTAALRAQDWQSLYALAFSGLRHSVTEADFVAKAEAGWADVGTVVSVTVVTPPALEDRRTGLDVAVAEISVATERDGVTVVHSADVTLLQESVGWRWISIDRTSGG